MSLGMIMHGTPPEPHPTMTTKRAIAAAASLAFLAGCQTTPPPPDPTGRANADMLRVLTAFQQTGARPVSTLPVDQARSQPTIGDAAAIVAQQIGVNAKQAVAKVADIQIQGDGAPIAARVYDPKAVHDASPVILYFHGGGWVTGTLDTYDAADRALANATGAIVVSVQYRLAPENKFPVAQNDADAAYGWLMQNAAMLGADPHRIALAGESAGGNLAINTAIWARDRKLPMPVHQLLVYPVVGTDLNTPSYEETTKAIPLNRAAIQWYVKNFTNGPVDLQDKRLNIVGSADLRGLPPTTIIAAEIDPLRSEDQLLAQKLTAAGVAVQQRTYPGVTHEFFGMGPVVAEARQAMDFAAGQLNASFANPPQMTPARMPLRRRPAM
jgi:acetyl esterase